MVLPALLCLAAQAPAPALAELIRAERAFAELASRQGTRAAFLANLHPRAVVFHPGPVDGRALWEARAEDRGLLTWHPAFAEVSEDGRLGYTSGPSEYRKDRSPATEPAWRGRFVSLWRKGEDGVWRVLFDAGDDQYAPEPPLEPCSPARPAAPRGLSPAREASLLEADGPHLPASGDLAYVVEKREGFASQGPSGGQASLRVWKKAQGAWRLRALLEQRLP